jgi:hypothetical protein
VNDSARWAVAVVRVIAGSGSGPVIRITELSDPLGDERVVSTTTSVDDAVAYLRGWLESASRPHPDAPRDR